MDNSYLLMFGIYAISAILLLQPFVTLGKFCFIKAPTFLWDFLRDNRGKNYYLNNPNGIDKDVTPNCMFTIWGLSHVVLYMILGWFVPNMFWQTLIIGIMFEYLENWTYDCHDILDVMWNTIGFLLGKYLRSVIRV